MKDEHPNDDSPGTGEGLQRAAGGLAFWMGALAIIGVLLSIIPMLLLLRAERLGWDYESIGLLVGSVFGCSVYLFLWQCAGSFRRAAKEEAGSRALENALWKLKILCCIVSILIVIGLATAVSPLMIRRQPSNQLSDATKEQIVDAVNKAFQESQRRGISRPERGLKPAPD